jgi:ABC-type antimicrobial peptide transport system permease subunit
MLGSGAGSDVAGSGAVPPEPPRPKKYYNPCPNPDRYYCDDTERMCKHRVPVVLSATVVELYNNQFAKSHGMPMADKNLVNLLIQQRGLSAMRFSVGLGHTTIAGSNAVTEQRPRRVEAVVVGVSTRAMPVGVTMPIQYIRRWNQEYMGAEAASSYSSIIVTLKDRNKLAPFSQWLIDEQDLRLEDSLGERFATVIFVIRLLFLIISVAILVIAVINIGHNFFIQVSERRREIGIMRAVGATEADVQLIVLGEAAVIGIVGGLLGIGLALGIGTAWNTYAASGIPRFPFKPESWFEFKTWIWASALGFSTLFCILGGYLPARRAARMEPAQALAQN